MRNRLFGTRAQGHFNRQNKAIANSHRRAGRRAIVEAVEPRLCLSAAYTAGSDYDLGASPDFLASADFNGDGKRDLVVSSYAAGGLVVLLGNGNGTFTGGASIAMPAAAPDFVAAADLNADGKQDLVIASYDNNTVSVLMGNGNGTFAAAVSYAAGTGGRAVVLADFTGDGRPDMAVAKSFIQSLTVLRNNGNGTFAAAAETALSFTPNDLVAGDFNGDGKQDLAAADFFTDRVALMLGNGNGTFAAATTYATGAGPVSIAAGDFNGDGKLDVATANFYDGTVSLLRGTGTGALGAASTLNPGAGAGGGATFVAAADLDGNGSIDLAVANANADSISLIWNNGDGTFASAVRHATGESPRSLLPAQFIAAGAMEIVVANQGTTSLSVYTGTVAPPAGPTANAGGPYSVAEGATVSLSVSGNTGSGLTYAWDLDGDGIFGETGAAATRGSETGATPVFSAAGLDGPSSRTVSLRVTDANGLSDTTTATVNITNVAPTLTISGNATVAEGSQYTLSLGSSDPGSDTITRWVINWGDGNTQTINSNPPSVMHAYADNGSYTITATATDEDGSYSANSKAISVTNVSPALTLGGNSTVAEGATYTLTLAETDPGNDTIIRWVINWGDGTAAQTVNGNPASVTHAFADNGSYIITATATDEDGSYSAAPKTVTVSNVAPTLTISGSASSSEGWVYVLSLTKSDPGADTISSWRINWGDGQTQTVLGSPASVTHSFADNGSYSITATATDEDGTYNSNARSVAVANVAPTLTIAGPNSISAGNPYTLVLASSDPGADTIASWRISWGDGMTETITGNPGSATHTYGGNTSLYTISATATDEDGTYNANTKTVTVIGAAPLANAGGPYTVTEGGSVVLDASASAGNALTYRWDLDGDGIFGESGSNAARGDETGATPTFAAAGLDGPSAYTVNVRVTAADSQTDTATATISVTNAAPSLSMSGAGTSAVGATYTLSLVSSDPGSDTISSWTISWGDGVFQTYGGNPSAVTHTYSAAGTFTISASAADEDGSYAAGAHSVSVAASDSVKPTATTNSAPNLLTGGGTSYSFAINLSDNSGIDLSSLDGQDILVTGPNGFSQYAGFVSVRSGAGTTRIATYSIAAPGAGWALTDNGTYTLSIRGNQVADLAGNYVAAANLGTFSVAVLPEDTAGYSMETARLIGDLPAGLVRAAVDGVGALDRNDFYKLTLTTTVNVYVKLYNLTDNADLMLMDSAGRRIAYSKSAGSRAEAFTKSLKAGTYYVRALYGSTLGTPYRLRLESLAPLKAPAPAGNGNFSGARDVGTLGAGLVRVVDDSVVRAEPVDYVRFSLDRTESVYLKLSNLSDNADLEILDADGRLLASSKRSGTNDEPLKVRLNAGTYYARVTFSGASGTSYRLRFATL